MEGITGFEEKLAQLLALARKKKNVLVYQEITSFFGEQQPSGDQMDQLFEFLDQNKVDVLQVGACLLYTSG